MGSRSEWILTKTSNVAVAIDRQGVWLGEPSHAPATMAWLSVYLERVASGVVRDSLLAGIEGSGVPTGAGVAAT